MKPLSDDQLNQTLARWTAPEPPPGLAGGVWARVDSRRPTWLEHPWTFRLATGLTLALWLAALWLPPRSTGPVASESLTMAFARAGGLR